MKNHALVSAVLAAMFAAMCANGADDAEKDEEKAGSIFDEAKRRAALVDEYADSFAGVSYFLKRDENGDPPNFSIPYECPGCGGTHFRDPVENIEKKMPVEFVAFVLSPDELIMKDVHVDSRFVERIEVECAGEKIEAKEFERCPDNEAVILKTVRPFKKAKPLKFTGGGMPDAPEYFYIASEGGERVAGIHDSDMPNFRRHVEAKCDVYDIKSNTLVLDDDDRPVTVAFQNRAILGKEVFDPPGKWRREKASARREREEALSARISRAVFPAYVQLESEKKEGFRQMMRWSDDSSAKNDIDTLLVLVGNKMFLPVALSPDDTARIVKMEAVMPDGARVPLEFVGSYRHRAAMAVKFAGKAPDGIEPLEADIRDPLAYFGKKLDLVVAENRDGAFKAEFGNAEVWGFSRGRKNVVKFRFTAGAGAASGDSHDKAPNVSFAMIGGKVASIGVSERTAGRRRSFSRDSSSPNALQGEDFKSFLGGNPDFDPENVPRSSKDRMRRPWLGVEVQKAGVDVLREKKALSFFGDEAGRAAMVVSVAPGTPAEKLGIKEGDILLEVKMEGSSGKVDLEIDSEPLSGLNWVEVFDDERFIDFGNAGEVTPWPNAEGGINEKLARFGVGAKVVVSWVSDGKRREGTAELSLQPVHYRNAPRSRSKDLGITVADMTYEVRKFHRFGEKDPGVVISKIKSGGTAAVAGLRPFEIILQVNGEDVHTAKEFVKKVKDAKELNLKVQRLTVTRMVPIKK